METETETDTEADAPLKPVANFIQKHLTALLTLATIIRRIFCTASVHLHTYR